MNKTLYVSNFPFDTKREELRKLFSRYGKVKSVQIINDEGGRSLGFAFIEMEDGGEKAIASLNGANSHGRPLVVNEAQSPSDESSEDPFLEVDARCIAFRSKPNSEDFRKVMQELRELAEAGHIDATMLLGNILASKGPHYDPESAYKWYYIALSQQGYSVKFQDENNDPPHYCGPVGDFRNESMVSELVETIGFDKVRVLDAEAARWLAKRRQ